MNDQLDQSDETEVTQDELSTLKARADLMGIKYHPSIGVESLRAKVTAALNSSEKKDPAPEAAAVVPAVEAPAAPVPETPQQAEARFRKELNAKARRLVRLRIANMNPAKKDLSGEFFCVGNRYVGTIKRFVPFGDATENGWHVEDMIYQQMRSRRFLQVKVRPDPRNPGHDIVDQRWVPEFSLEVLPQLTEEELKELARMQAAGGHID